jgi:hypothetical protein
VFVKFTSRIRRFSSINSATSFDNTSPPKGHTIWLFARSIRGGERNAALLTLASSAIRNDLDVWRYIKDVLDQLLAGSTDY